MSHLEKKAASQKAPKAVYGSDTDKWDEASADLSDAISERESRSTVAEPQNISPTPKQSGRGHSKMPSAKIDALVIDPMPTESFGYYSSVEKGAWLRK
jgi:recombinational DNA repair protein RecT